MLDIKKTTFCPLTTMFSYFVLAPEFLEVGASQFQQSSGALKNKMWLENLKVVHKYGFNSAVSTFFVKKLFALLFYF